MSTLREPERGEKAILMRELMQANPGLGNTSLAGLFIEAMKKKGVVEDRDHSKVAQGFANQKSMDKKIPIKKGRVGRPPSILGKSVFTLLDLEAFDLPLLDEPLPPVRGQYHHDHTKRWSAAVSAVDGFVMVTPEYNHSTSAALKNALDYLYREWNDKAVGFVSYGGRGGTRAVEHLRLIAAETT